LINKFSFCNAINWDLQLGDSISLIFCKLSDTISDTSLAKIDKAADNSNCSSWMLSWLFLLLKLLNIISLLS